MIRLKKWLESKKQENGTFNLTKCKKFSEPTLSTNNKRRKLTNLQKKANMQKENFKNFFTHPAQKSTHPSPTSENLQTQASSQKTESVLKNPFETRKRKIIHDECEKFTSKKKNGTVGNLLKMFENKQPQKANLVTRNIIRRQFKTAEQLETNIPQTGKFQTKKIEESC